MAKKSGNIEGSIFKREYKRKDKNGTEQTYTYFILDFAGKQYSFKEEREAKTKRRELIKLVDSGAKTDKITVGEWLQKWLNDYKRNSVRGTTFDSYKIQVDKHIIPELGLIKLQDLKTDDVQGFINNLAGKGLSPRTISYNNYVLKTAIQQAIDIEPPLLIRNPAQKTVLPKQEKPVKDTLSFKQMESLKANNEKHYLYAALILAMYTGLRRGEILGLKWNNVDFNEKVINVEYNLVKLNDKVSLEQYPKTSAGIRQIPMNELVIKALKDHKYKQNNPSKRSKYQDVKNKHGLVFITRVGNWVHPDSFNRSVDVWASHAGIEYLSPHIFRHTFATRLLERGVDIGTVAMLLGHEDSRFTSDTYVHPNLNMLRNAIEKL